MIAPGRYKLRKGHDAEVTGPKTLFCQGKSYPIWVGRCITCNERKTWNPDGTYAGVGLHPCDLMVL